MKKPYFPMFIDLEGKHIFVAGGGKIACRRIKALLPFGPQIYVSAPLICSELEKLTEKYPEYIHIFRRCCRPSDILEMDFVIAATDDRKVNREVYEACKKKNIPVNVADEKKLCDFYFPALVITSDVVIGIGSGGEDPGRVREVRRRIQRMGNIGEITSADPDEKNNY